MNFELTSEQDALREAFARFLDEQSSMSRVRAALPSGFDRDLWAQLGELGAFSVRVPVEKEGLGQGLVAAVSLMEEAGRTLASGPLAEAIVATRLLAEVEGEGELLNKVMRGEILVTLALHDISAQPVQWIAGAAVADAVLAIDGDKLVLIDIAGAERCAGADLGYVSAGRISLVKYGHRTVAEGAAEIFSAAVEEWKLLTAATLSGMAREAIRLASAYACERIQFGQPIGAYQGLSHPLADLICEVEAGKLLIWQAIRQIADASSEAGAAISLALWWNADTSARAGSQAVQTLGGYGLTTEYDVYLYNLRAKALPLALGDVSRLLEEAGARLYGPTAVPLPKAGEMPIEFGLGSEALAYAAEVDAFFRANLTPELKEHAHFSWEGHDPGLQRKLGEAGLLFPGWPKEDGGRGLSPYAITAGADVWADHGWTTYATGTTGMIGTIIRKFGTNEVRQDVLTKIVAGEIICSLGYSEPASGSDVFAAQCRATPVDGGWRIDGTKMFTSGANLSSYVLMLARTDPEAPKHKGLTMFVVPLKAEGVTIQPVHTFMDERTNITFYDGVIIPDSYRLGDVNGGNRVMSAALELEHGGGFSRDQFNMLHAAEALCREIDWHGRPLIEDAAARARLARAYANAQASRLLGYRSMWAGVNGKSHPAYGPMTKMFSSERFLSDVRDLMNLTAPVSLSREDGHAGEINLAYRHAHGTRVYGGTSQVHRSIIAERFLGLPRSRAAG